MTISFSKFPIYQPFVALFFDLGNTLIYFDGDWPEVLSRASKKLWESLREAGLELDKELFMHEFFVRLNEYYVERETDQTEITTTFLLRKLLTERGYPNVPETILRGSLAAMYSVSQEHWHIEDDTIPVLSELRCQGYKLGIISNAADDQDIQKLVDKTEIRPFFDLIISSAAIGIRKPNHLIFKWALNQLSVAPDQAAMIGDTMDADIQGAQNAQMFSIFLTRRAQQPANRTQVKSIVPDAVIQTLSELPKLLSSDYLRNSLRKDK